jgi:hypothetical protein
MHTYQSPSGVLLTSAPCYTEPQSFEGKTSTSTGIQRLSVGPQSAAVLGLALAGSHMSQTHSNACRKRDSHWQCGSGRQQIYNAWLLYNSSIPSKSDHTHSSWWPQFTDSQPIKPTTNTANHPSQSANVHSSTTIRLLVHSIHTTRLCAPQRTPAVLALNWVQNLHGESLHNTVALLLPCRQHVKHMLLYRAQWCSPT